MKESQDGFKITMQIAKSYTGQGEGDEKPGMFIGGIASGTNVDHHSDRMAKSAIEAFSKAIKEGVVLPDGQWSQLPLRSGHRMEWDDVLGWITKADIDQDHNLWIEAELDENNSTARDLFAKLQQGSRPGKPLQLGLSVGGKITKASYEWSTDLNKRVRVIEGVKLNEISVVGWPANPSAYVEALTKSVDWDALEKADNDQQESSMNEEVKETTDTLSKNDEQNLAAVQEKFEKATSALETTMTSIQEQIATMTKAIEALTSKSEPESITKSTDAENTTVAATSDEIVKAVGGLEAKVTTALESVMTKMSDDILTPLSARVDALAKTVEEIASTPMDKSAAVRRAKETDSALESFAKNLAEKSKSHGQVDIIGEAVRASFKARS